MTRVLALFSGVGLLDSAFEAEGFTVVRGPDILWGGDIRSFHPGRGGFDGIIGGPPCQDFSSARRTAPVLDGYGVEMLGEFARVVREVGPRWWMMENVDAVPDVRIDGYSWQRLDVEQAWFCAVRRLRHIQFGANPEAYIEVAPRPIVAGAQPAALACDGRSVEELKALQGLPEHFDLPPFTVEAKKRAIGNGVPIVMGRVLAAAVRRAIDGIDSPALASTRAVVRRCACSCGRQVRGRAMYAGVSCRKRAERARRDEPRAQPVTSPGSRV